MSDTVWKWIYFMLAGEMILFHNQERKAFLSSVLNEDNSPIPTSPFKPKQEKTAQLSRAEKQFLILRLFYSLCRRCITISIHRAMVKHKKKGEGSFACTTNWSSSLESIPGVRWNKFSTSSMDFDPDAHLSLVSIKRPKDLWEKYWPQALLAIL